MAAAQVVAQSVFEPAIERRVEPSADVRLEIHDTTRLEWAVSVPLPAQDETDYAIELDVEIPAHVLAEHSPWDHLQELARLDGPEDTACGGSVDGVRRFAVAVAAKMSRAHDGFCRHVRLAGSPLRAEPLAEHARALEAWLDAATGILADARRRLRAAPDTLDVSRETRLADEYLSARFLELLAGCERALATLYDVATDDTALVAQVDDAIGDALAAEIDHRAAAGYPEAAADSPRGLERYLDRASQLKKHFQEVLFLESEHYAVSERLYHFVAAGVAIVASTWAFVWQIYLSHGKSMSAQLRSLIALCFVAGLVYAAKDRMKEIGRTWFARNVHRFYAQRVARYRAPAKTFASHPVVVRARESFLREKKLRPDPLNPESGATLAFTSLRYRHRGTLASSRELAAAGMSRVKHVFRYDLSPMFARLDDATKPVPVFDSTMRRVRFAHAPRCYRLPVSLVVRIDGAVVSEQRGSLVLHKRGLERIELE